MPPCSFCKKPGHNIVTCKVRLKNNVEESETLVKLMSDAADIARFSRAVDRTGTDGKALVAQLLSATVIAQNKLDKDEKRFEEVQRQGKGGDDPDEWVRIDVAGAGLPSGDGDPVRLSANDEQTGSPPTKPSEGCACGSDRAACGQCGRGWAQEKQRR